MHSSNCSTYVRALVVLSAAALGTAACSPKVRNYGDGSGGVGGGGGGSGDGGADPAGGGDGGSSNSSSSSGGGRAEPGRFQRALQLGENGYDSAVSVAVDPSGQVTPTRPAGSRSGPTPPPAAAARVTTTTGRPATA